MTGALLIGFLDREARGGELHPGTASSRRSAVREILQLAYGDDWENTVFTIEDVPALLQEFVDERTGDFGDNTIASYRSNFRRTVELFLDAVEPEGPGDHDETGWITYRFQVRGSQLVEFELPEDLTTAEAKRLSRFVMALPLDAADE